MFLVVVLIFPVRWGKLRIYTTSGSRMTVKSNLWLYWAKFHKKMFSMVFSGRYCWNILICLLLDTILDLLRLASKLVSPTALQALACFLVHILADFATFSSGGAKTEKLYNDFNFYSLKEAFCGVEWTEKKIIQGVCFVLH